MKRFLIFTLTVLLLHSCTELKEVTKTTRKAKYYISLNKVELPSNSKEQFSEKIQKQRSSEGVYKYSFADEKISIYWSILNDEFAFTIHNKTNHALKINWDNVVFIKPDRTISKMVHSGTKYSRINEGQVPTTIPRGTYLEDVLVPAENITYMADNWITLPLLPNTFDSDHELQKAKELESSELSIFLPIEIENVPNEYTFHFKIDKVETQTKTDTRYTRQPTVNSNYIAWGAVGGVVLAIVAYYVYLKIH